MTDNQNYAYQLIQNQGLIFSKYITEISQISDVFSVNHTSLTLTNFYTSKLKMYENYIVSTVSDNTINIGCDPNTTTMNICCNDDNDIALNLGTGTHEGTITIGSRYGHVVIQGELTYTSASQYLTVEGKKIFINSGIGQEDCGDSGIYIRENEEDVAYIALNSDKTGFEFNIPPKTNEYVVSLIPPASVDSYIILSQGNQTINGTMTIIGDTTVYNADFYTYGNAQIEPLAEDDLFLKIGCKGTDTRTYLIFGYNNNYELDQPSIIRNADEDKLTITSQLYISDTTGTSSYSTGALTVDGGVGIGEDLRVYNAAYIPTITSTTIYGTTFDTNVATAGVTLSGTTILADGTNENIDITFTPKGTGNVVLERAEITDCIIYHPVDLSVTGLLRIRSAGFEIDNEGQFLMGPDDEMGMYHDGINGYFTNLTGKLIVTNPDDIDLNVTGDINIPVNVGITFSADTFKIESDGTNITINSASDINLTATNDINIPTSVGLTFSADTFKIESNGTDLTVNSASDINLTATNDINIPTSVGLTFSADTFKIESNGTDLTVNSASDINLTATNDINIPTSVGLTFSADTFKIESDGTDLAVNSNNDINLTATSDVNIPVNVGLTFSADTFKIESDGTDLTVNSASDINLTATNDINIPTSVGLTFSADTFKIESDGTDLTISSNNDIILASTANIGINETSPDTILHISHASPHITLQNITDENTDGGAESLLIFKDHSDSIIGKLEVSHDGELDDTKGQMIIYVNNGTSLDVALTIDSDGTVTIPGDLTVTGTATVSEAEIANTVNELTIAEVNQLKNIDTSTISTTQWGYIGELDQSLTTASDLQFKYINTTGSTSSWTTNAWKKSLKINNESAIQIAGTSTHYGIGNSDSDVLHVFYTTTDTSLDDSAHYMISMLTDGKIGINNTVPTEQLHIIGNVKVNDSNYIKLGTSSDLQLYHNGTNSYITNATGDLVVKLADASGTNELSIVDSSDVEIANVDSDGNSYFAGNMCIGTSTPYGKLNIFTGTSGNTTDIANQLSGSFSFTNGSSGSAIPTIIGKTTTGGIIYVSATNDSNSGNDLNFSIRESDGTDYTTLDSGGFVFSRYTTELMRILRNGNVGINNTEATEKLHVIGNIKVNDSNYVKIGTGDDLQLYHDGSNSYIDNSTGDLNIKLADNAGSNKLAILDSDSTELMCVDSNGNVGIGTNSPSSVLHVDGDIKCDYIKSNYPYWRMTTCDFDNDIDLLRFEVTKSLETASFQILYAQLYLNIPENDTAVDETMSFFMPTTTFGGTYRNVMGNHGSELVYRCRFSYLGNSDIFNDDDSCWVGITTSSTTPRRGFGIGINAQSSKTYLSYSPTPYVVDSGWTTTSVEYASGTVYWIRMVNNSTSTTVDNNIRIYIGTQSTANDPVVWTDIGGGSGLYYTDSSSMYNLEARLVKNGIYTKQMLIDCVAFYQRRSTTATY